MGRKSVGERKKLVVERRIVKVSYKNRKTAAQIDCIAVLAIYFPCFFLPYPSFSNLTYTKLNCLNQLSFAVESHQLQASHLHINFTATTATKIHSKKQI